MFVQTKYNAFLPHDIIVICTAQKYITIFEKDIYNCLKECKINKLQKIFKRQFYVILSKKKCLAKYVIS